MKKDRESNAKKGIVEVKITNKFGCTIDEDMNTNEFIDEVYDIMVSVMLQHKNKEFFDLTLFNELFDHALITIMKDSLKTIRDKSCGEDIETIICYINVKDLVNSTININYSNIHN